ncbi:hypothetical protein, partial [Sulfitobacter sp. HI0023]|uniref:hypothetical protein n=1 Tax=Sulfitobacter sp. HI0023 TaxID=1822225 RepID=UPI001F2CA423
PRKGPEGGAGTAPIDGETYSALRYVNQSCGCMTVHFPAAPFFALSFIYERQALRAIWIRVNIASVW